MMIDDHETFMSATASATIILLLRALVSLLIFVTLFTQLINRMLLNIAVLFLFHYKDR